MQRSRVIIACACSDRSSDGVVDDDDDDDDDDISVSQSVSQSVIRANCLCTYIHTY